MNPNYPATKFSIPPPRSLLHLSASCTVCIRNLRHLNWHRHNAVCRLHRQWREQERWPIAATYRVIHQSLRNFQTRLRNNQDRHGRKEHIN